MIRREIVLGGALVILWGDKCLCQTAEHSFGCCVPPSKAASFFAASGDVSTFESPEGKLEPRSGNNDLDRALAKTLYHLSIKFDVLPGFSFYQEAEKPNALASEARRLKRADGTVLFGLKMLSFLLQSSEKPSAAIAAVCAHEFGHIVSFKRDLISELAPDRDKPYKAEQFADFMCGFYGGLRKLENKDFPAVAFATTQSSMAGTTRGSHGSRFERGQAVSEGFKAANDRKLNVNEGVDAAFSYAMGQK